MCGKWGLRCQLDGFSTSAGKEPDDPMDGWGEWVVWNHLGFVLLLFVFLLSLVHIIYIGWKEEEGANGATRVSGARRRRRLYIYVYTKMEDGSWMEDVGWMEEKKGMGQAATRIRID